jgi:hypothetical protein
MIPILKTEDYLSEGGGPVNHPSGNFTFEADLSQDEPFQK